MKLIFWDKIKDRINKYKSDKKYSHLFIAALYILVLVIEVILNIIWIIILRFYHAFQEWDRNDKIHRERQKELRAIRHKAAVAGSQTGITASTSQTIVVIEPGGGYIAEPKVRCGRCRGTGQIPDEVFFGKRKCPNCGGTGWI